MKIKTVVHEHNATLNTSTLNSATTTSASLK